MIQNTYQLYKETIENTVRAIIKDTAISHRDLVALFGNKNLATKIEKISGTHYEICLGIAIEHMKREKKLIETREGHYSLNKEYNG